MKKLVLFLALAVLAPAFSFAPAANAQERITGYAIDTVTLYDVKGAVLNRVASGEMPAIPAGGVTFKTLNKGLVQANVDGRTLVLNRGHLRIEGTVLAKGIDSACNKVRSKPGEKRANNIGMGLGGCD